jgi:UDP-2-acetamido-2,6-beta-L-arabino-hexul-4-ose reductase
MRIVVTGAHGFIGKNLCVRLREWAKAEVVPVGRDVTDQRFDSAVAEADFVFHLAGVNRPKNDEDFVAGNVILTERLCAGLRSAGRKTPVALTSSTQAALENPYGKSKRQAEEALRAYAAETGAPAHIFRLTNVFGKWARPNYNSAVATFCYNVAHGLPITIHDPSAKLRLVYIDDVVDAFIALLESPSGANGEFADVQTVYDTTVGEVADAIRGFDESRRSLTTARVGEGMTRALYSTYLSYLPAEKFSYQVPQYSDPRGEFAEVLKTPDCGQFSYFTAGPGVTRGEHYHHSKTEKFIVIRGRAKFQFRHIGTGQFHEIDVRGGSGEIIETVPGWAHNIINVGEDELIVMLWANEVFDRSRPDTIAMKVNG